MCSAFERQDIMVVSPAPERLDPDIKKAFHPGYIVSIVLIVIGLALIFTVAFWAVGAIVVALGLVGFLTSYFLKKGGG